MKSTLRRLIESAGYTVQKTGAPGNGFTDIDDQNFWELYRKCKPFTMTSVERMYALYTSVLHVLKNNVPGDFVECGVWRGGSALLMAEILHQRNIRDKKIYLYDTFEGMSEPTDKDIDLRGQGAGFLLEKNKSNKETSVWCLAGIEDVTNNMRLSNFPIEKIILVKGKVEDTIPHTGPQNGIAILRLDTDWYESTRHELLHLYPMLSSKGVLIIDDYGHWQGCRKAVDEYFSAINDPVMLTRIDYTGRIAIKP